MKKYIYSVIILCAFTITAKAQTDLQHTSQGALYNLFTHNTGDRIKNDDVITLQITQKTDKDSLLSSTYALGHPVQIKVTPSQNVTDMMEIFPLLTNGDSVLVKIPADSVFKGHETSRPPFFPAGSFFNFYIKIVKVQSLDEAIAERNAQLAKIQADEKVDANKYITSNKLMLKTTASGLRYVIFKPSTKPKPRAGDTVLVNYSGKLLNGQVFDTSIAAVAEKAGLLQEGRTYEPISFVVGSGQVIKGWDEGLLLLNAGAKAKFVIPSSLAYGEQGQGETIPPYSTLVFDVELVSVKPIPHPKPAATPGTKKPAAKKHTTATTAKKKS
jgi:FKBP-type peptidyl-prolyl cis-trans isomerase FkpA